MEQMEQGEKKQEAAVARSQKSLETAGQASTVLKAWYQRLNSAKERGEFLAWTMIFVPYDLLLSFDVLPVFIENYGPVCAAKQVATHFCEIAEGERFAKDTCSYLRIGLGYAAEYNRVGGVPEKAPWGGLPKPDMMIGPSAICEGRIKFLQAAQRYWNVPYCCYEALNMPFHTAAEAEHNEEIKKHYVKLYYEQLKNVLIPFLEKTTGKKFDKNKLSETLALDMEHQRLYEATNKLLKARPAPYGAQDSFTMCAPSIVCRGTQETVDYYQRLYDEVKYRVDHKIGVVQDEKYRILWAWLPPWYALSIFNHFESKSAVAVTQAYDIGIVPENIDLDNPLETIARKMYEGSWYGAGSQWTSRASKDLRFVQDYGVDGIIILQAESCRRFSMGYLHTVELLKEKSDVPILDLKSDMADKRFWSEEKMKDTIDMFLETIDKKRRR
ncbi:2-hydroxyglutaryl-CoA dehydratase [Desulfosarcina ovata subsp. sediminis]|uniref:2-hydroxyglutaryl-CoA dehydratase n=1 Tax=Desulfosarcina ovata subsp. sediminis TaxID=885957 RepID=A0A5K7ZL09_9BACT|nr:2-hydroxyacyl-CoA dehydratase family protein [Desulfosarcina ovata]BBO82064.1 2-hydroxyglutaryl-CoA dehydratase [Desulfosarcina ovata subsp. sediminis]